tara:strand:+ start:78 stop:479 length:402 start_codon:yes stop_codon:yes gene_type:complete
VTTQAIQDMPASWEGSEPEWITYNVLVQLGKVPDEDFTYQSPLMGGRLEKGGSIVDFVFKDPPDLGINVQGNYYHYGMGVETATRDILARVQLASLGMILIFIDESSLEDDPFYYVREALRYRDHSRLGGRGL